MASELKHTVKPSGGDFTSLGAAVDHLEATHPGLVAADVYALIEIDGTWAASDTTYSTIHNITTDATHYIYIYTTAAARHKGIPSTSYYNIKGDGYGTAMVDVYVNYVTVEGIQAWNLTTWGDSDAYRNHGYDYIIFRKCIGRVTGSAQHAFMDDDNADYSYFQNCLAYLSYMGFMIHKTAHNCTAAHCTYGFYAPYWAATYENCLGHGNTTADFARAGSEVLTLNNCSSGDGTADDFAGANNLVNQTFKFVDHDGNDFHLASDDAGARDHGKDESGIFTDDIDGETRSGTWDIGFDEYIAGEEPIDLIPAENYQIQISDAPALTQVHNLVVAEGYQAQASDAPALTQVHTLVAAEGMQVQVSDSPIITVSPIDLVAAEGMQVEISDSPVLTQVHMLVADEGVQVQISDASALTQAHILVTQEGIQEQISDSPVLTQAHTLIPAECYQEQVSDIPVLTQLHILATQEGIQEQISDEPTLTVDGINLTAAEGMQVQASDVPALTQLHVLVPAEGVQAQVSDVPILTQTHILVPTEGVQAQVSDEATITVGGINLIAAENIQDQASDSPALTQLHQLAANKGYQGQFSDAAILDMSIWLASQEGYQGQFSDSPALTQITAHPGISSSLWASKKGLHRTSRVKWYMPSRWYKPLERWFK